MMQECLLGGYEAQGASRGRKVSQNVKIEKTAHLFQNQILEKMGQFPVFNQQIFFGHLAIYDLADRVGDATRP